MVGDPTEGRRAPYTGTADGIGLGDPKKVKEQCNLSRNVRVLLENCLT